MCYKKSREIMIKLLRPWILNIENIELEPEMYIDTLKSSHCSIKDFIESNSTKKVYPQTLFTYNEINRINLASDQELMIRSFLAFTLPCYLSKLQIDYIGIKCFNLIPL